MVVDPNSPGSGEYLQKFMKRITLPSTFFLASSVAIALAAPLFSAEQPSTEPATEATKTQENAFAVDLPEGKKLWIDFYGENIIRLFRDDAGGKIRNPEAEPPAQILVNQPRRDPGEVKITESGGKTTASTDAISVEVDRKTGLMKVTDLRTDKVVLEEIRPVAITEDQTISVFKERPDEYFYGGGVQNGRFSHKGKSIAIENQNSWTDGGVASPNPFYWSTAGYGILWHTFKPGTYDFGASKPGEVTVSHDSSYLDLFVMVDEKPVDLLKDYYQLTGGAALLPKFGFYQGHLNAYNRDYWKENEDGILFEDGKRYKESQEKDEDAIRESLNGENENYQFSARAVVDRYEAHDMPLGWVLPNDGYGAGYGQGETLDENIENLKAFGYYSKGKGVEIGLWTQSDLHPKEDVSALLQRDIVKEVRDAGVRVLKTDVAWVGAGYSFGLNGVADAAEIMTKYGDNSRPFIITLDGWAGTQRYAGIWSGDQTGGEWEYIRFHIPTYIGSGLSGSPNISSDMDGIFGGKKPIVNIRDYQWKTFSPMELNMDGWGANPKYPHALGEPTTSINRWYLKLKSELMPYTYSIAQESVHGLPMVRAMFLEFPNEYTLGSATKYQFLYGPDFLVAPVYRENRADEDGNDIRNGIYLPEGRWIDWFSGEVYTGGRIINEFPVPIWKLPVFVKQGAIIPITDPHNQVSDISPDKRSYEFYPRGKSSFTEYDDDGVSEAYKAGAGTFTKIESEVSDAGKVTITIHPTTGDFEGFVKEKATELRINATAKPTALSAAIGGKTLELTEAESMEALAKMENAFFYEEAPNLNRFATPDSDFEKVVVTKNPLIHIRLAPADITAAPTVVTVEGYRYEPKDTLLVSTGDLKTPTATISTEPYSLTPSWEKVANADYYEIEFGGMILSTIKSTEFTIEDLEPATEYQFKLRAVNRSGTSEWTELAAATKPDPLRFAIRGIVAKSTAADQGGASINNLFDFDETKDWHTQWGKKAVPFEFVVDLKSVNQLEKMRYLPRKDGGNGTLTKGAVYHSMDKQSWTKVEDFAWELNGEEKTVNFANKPTAGYLKIEVTEAKGDFGSGRELYVFKVPGSESYIQGDINHDGKIDENDLTSYKNYTGLRKGDADFEGYISKGDIDGNGIIDAYDISVVATQLNGGVKEETAENEDSEETEDGEKIDKSEDEEKPVKELPSLAGKLTLSTPKQDFKAGEPLEITVSGADLNRVNALSFGLPYDAQDLEFVKIRPLNLKKMENLTLDRLHTDGEKVLYATFLNIGEQETLQGSEDLFVIEMKAKRDLDFIPKPTTGVLVDKQLNQIKPW